MQNRCRESENIDVILTSARGLKSADSRTSRWSPIDYGADKCCVPLDTVLNIHGVAPAERSGGTRQAPDSSSWLARRGHSAEYATAHQYHTSRKPARVVAGLRRAAVRGLSAGCGNSDRGAGERRLGRSSGGGKEGQRQLPASHTDSASVGRGVPWGGLRCTRSPLKLIETRPVEATRGELNTEHRCVEPRPLPPPPPPSPPGIMKRW
ncbi:hypothetical protein O3P69_005058 [Scylla paramamosain]|uniref:Uncharacterized protein n=1 Tax=Scylla paramamosain TaxID=85552 RepID=A0AAW0U9R8_SCYPA